MAKKKPAASTEPNLDELGTSSAYQWFQKVQRGEATVDQVPGLKRRKYVQAALDHPEPMRLFPFSRGTVNPSTRRIVGPSEVRG